MPFYPKKKSSDFIPAPAGLHLCVCVDLVDLGLVKTTWAGSESIKDMLRLVWQTEDRIPNGPKAGQRYLINKRYTNSVHSKAGIRLHVEAWSGKKFTDEEFAAFDLERLVGKMCQIQIVHNVSDGNTYANINAIMQAPKNSARLVVEGYTRVKDRPGYVPPPIPADNQAQAAPPDDDDWGASTASSDAEVPPPSIPEEDIPF